MSQDEFTKGPYRSGILTKEEEESILVTLATFCNFFQLLDLSLLTNLGNIVYFDFHINIFLLLSNVLTRTASAG